jgi:hypothetical protein
MWILSIFKFNILKTTNRSPKWRQLRKTHLIKQPNCMVCGSSYRPEVHHIIPVHLDPSKELDPNNLITLCDKYCHFIFGHLMNWWSHNPDIIEDANIFSSKILKAKGQIK